MFKNIKTKILSIAAIIGAGALALGSHVFAAVDPDVASTSQSVVTTLKDNITGVLIANLPNIVIVGVMLFSIGFVWRLARHFMGGH
jgi:ABC-type lipopolysaccharide export system ATPase subunit